MERLHDSDVEASWLEARLAMGLIDAARTKSGMLLPAEVDCCLGLAAEPVAHETAPRPDPLRPGRLGTPVVTPAWDWPTHAPYGCSEAPAELDASTDPDR